jgi:hypothetical protein
MRRQKKENFGIQGAPSGEVSAPRRSVHFQVKKDFNIYEQIILVNAMTFTVVNLLASNMLYAKDAYDQRYS